MFAYQLEDCGGAMSNLERRVLAELRRVHEAEAALEGMYQTLSRPGADNGRFMASLRSLDERVSRLESLLESAA
jgi:hypothetical protein